MRLIKKLFFWALIGGIVYFFLSYHIIFIGSSPYLLKKSRLTLDYIFFSTQAKEVKSILAIDDLREDGIGELLLKAGKVTEVELERLIAQIEEGDS